jgi:hypothetical protein
MKLYGRVHVQVSVFFTLVPLEMSVQFHAPVTPNPLPPRKGPMDMRLSGPQRQYGQYEGELRFSRR